MYVAYREGNKILSYLDTIEQKDIFLQNLGKAEDCSSATCCT